jgi:hypothetical protein
MRSYQIVEPETPVLTDKIISQVNQHLLSKLPWLDNLYPEAEKLRVKDDKTPFRQRVLYYPAVFIDQNNYLPMYPDQGNGNFLFWLLHDNQDQILNFKPNDFQDIKQAFSIIIWYDVNSASNELGTRNIAKVQREVLNALTQVFAPDLNQLVVTNIEKEVQNIYKEFNFTNIEDQYTMHPWAAMRVNGFLYFNDNCL